MTILELLTSRAAIGDDVGSDRGGRSASQRGRSARVRLSRRRSSAALLSASSPSRTARRHTRTRNPGRGPLARVRRREQRPRPLGIGADAVHRVGLPDGRRRPPRHARGTRSAPTARPAASSFTPSVHDWHPRITRPAARRSVDCPPPPGRRAVVVLRGASSSERLVSSRPRLLRLEGTERQRAARPHAWHGIGAGSGASARPRARLPEPRSDRAPLATVRDVRGAGHVSRRRPTRRERRVLRCEVPHRRTQWDFALDPYELGRSREVVSHVDPARHRRVFEPGCSIGVLTEMSASDARCRWTQSDLSEVAVQRPTALRPLL